MPFDIRLKNMQTPSRLFALCRLVQYKSFLRDELRDLLQPPGLRKDKSSYEQFNEVLRLARIGGLVTEDEDDKVMLQMGDEELARPSDFRKAIVRRIISQPDHIFCRFTAWYLLRGVSVYTENAKTLMQEFDRELNQAKSQNVYNENNITAWRTWAAFLGYGFTHNQILVPNTSVRLTDALEENNRLVKDEILPIRQFVEWMSVHCPELDYGQISMQSKGSAQWPKQHFSTGISAGLRSLHDMKKIELLYSNDATDIWYLTTVDAHEIKDRVSAVVVRGWPA
ncbi:MAG: hypothetical protein KGZ79_07770 [Dethiobacter sp.]|jgi:hypothetical protein|nr:hypothetical protein [Dethiobacter sp.]